MSSKQDRASTVTIIRFKGLHSFLRSKGGCIKEEWEAAGVKREKNRGREPYLL